MVLATLFGSMFRTISSTRARRSYSAFHPQSCWALESSNAMGHESAEGEDKGEGGKEGRREGGEGGERMGRCGINRRMEMDERNTPTAKQSIGILCLCLTRLSAEM